MPSWLVLVVEINNEKIVQGNLEKKRKMKYSPTEPATTDHL
jgi:hypothetical protein